MNLCKADAQYGANDVLTSASLNIGPLWLYSALI
jgi:hypothetical protein